MFTTYCIFTIHSDKFVIFENFINERVKGPFPFFFSFYLFTCQSRLREVLLGYAFPFFLLSFSILFLWDVWRLISRLFFFFFTRSTVYGQKLSKRQGLSSKENKGLTGTGTGTNPEMNIYRQH